MYDDNVVVVALDDVLVDRRVDGVLLMRCCVPAGLLCRPLNVDLPQQYCRVIRNQPLSVRQRRCV